MSSLTVTFLNSVMGSDSAWKYTGSNLDKRNILHASLYFHLTPNVLFLTLYCAMCIALVSAVVLPLNFNSPGSLLATIAVLFAYIDDESIMQWSFPSADREPFMRMQFILSALVTTFDETNVGFPIT
jgi:hypothetical protein